MQQLLSKNRVGLFFKGGAIFQRLWYVCVRDRCKTAGGGLSRYGPISMCIVTGKAIIQDRCVLHGIYVSNSRDAKAILVV